MDENKLDAASARAWVDWWERINTVLDLETKAEIVVPLEVAQLANERENARREKNWKRSDELRERIFALGWEVRDTKDGQKLTRRAVARALEMDIAFTACSAPTKYKFFAVADKIDKRPDCRLRIAECGLLALLARCVGVGRWAFGVGRWALGVGRWAFLFVNRPDNRANWNLYDLVRACASRHFFPHPVPAILCFNDRLVKEIGEIINMPVGPQDHVASAPAIAAIWPTFRHKFLAPKTDGAAPALSRLCKSFDPIDKHGFAALHR